MLFVVGTKPEAIKLAPVIKAVQPSALNATVCVSGQHSTRALDQLREFGLRADIVCDPVLHPVGPSQLLGSLVRQLGDVVQSVRPHLVVVQGDTATSLAAALAAFERRIGVAHVEAGLRTGNLAAPFPEESYRRMISAIATLHFAPTAAAAAHLRAEGVNENSVYVTGNTVVDAFNEQIGRCTLGHREVERWRVLVSLHRRESLGPRLEGMFGAVRTLAATHQKHDFVCHISDNPMVRLAFDSTGGGSGLSNMTSVGPLSHRAFLELIATSHFVMTDSGGVQEEAPLFGTPVLVLRNETDRPEGVHSGGARLVGTSTDAILNTANELIGNRLIYERMAVVRSPFGDGKAAARIADAITRHLLKRSMTNP